MTFPNPTNKTTFLATKYALVSLDETVSAKGEEPIKAIELC